MREDATFRLWFGAGLAIPGLPNALSHQSEGLDSDGRICVAYNETGQDIEGGRAVSFDEACEVADKAGKAGKAVASLDQPRQLHHMLRRSPRIFPQTPPPSLN